MVHRVRGIYLDSSRCPRANAGEQRRQRQAAARGGSKRKSGKSCTDHAGGKRKAWHADTGTIGERDCDDDGGAGCVCVHHRDADCSTRHHCWRCGDDLFIDGSCEWRRSSRCRRWWRGAGDGRFDLRCAPT